MKVEDNNALFMKYYESKSEEDYEKLFLNNVYLIKHIINKNIKLPLLTHKQIMDEFIDVGYIGLVQAIKNYDPSKMKKVSFTTFAYSCIQNEIYKYLKTRPYTIDSNISLDYNFIGDDEETNLAYFLGAEDEKLNNLLEDYYAEYLKKIVASLLKTLNNQRDIEIVKMYYGINDENRMYNYREISEKFNCTKENVRHVINNSLEKIKERLGKLNINKINPHYINLSLEEIEETMQKYKNRKSARLSKLLEKYSKEEVNNAIEKLEGKHKTLLKMYLGQDREYMTYKEISEETNMKISHVIHYVNYAFKKIEQILEKKTKGKIDVFKKYDIEIIEGATKKLKEKEQMFYKTYIKCNGSIKQIADIFNIDIQTAYRLKYKVFETIESIIENGHNETDIYTNFINTYGQEKVKEALAMLNNSQREIIEKCVEYDFDYNKINKFYGFEDKNKVYRIKYKAFENLENLLKGANFKRKQK